MTASPDDIARFFAARSVAVVGASRSLGKAGNVQLQNLARAFRGRVVPINPHAVEINGLPCFPSLDAVPEPVDLAILLVPAERTLAEVDACVRCGVRAILIPSAGFAESGEGGLARQHELVQRARQGRARIWGPNCNGLVDAHRGLWASFSELHKIRPGNVGIIAHTGIFAAGYLNQLTELPAFGVSKVATLGNSCDITAEEVLRFLAEDDDTHAIAVHLEGLVDGRAFFDACRYVAARKPVIILPAGLSRAGARASQTHTANLSADTRVTEAALRQAGAHLVDDFDELAALASQLAIKRRRLGGRRISVLSTSGGAGVLASDHLSRAGLDLAVLGESTLGRLRSLHASLAVADAPLDVWPAMERLGPNDVVRAALGAVLDDPAVDSSLLLLGAFSGGGSDFDPTVLQSVLAGTHKPVVAWLYGPAAIRERWTVALAELEIPVATGLRGAATALAAMQPRRIGTTTPEADCDIARLTSAAAFVGKAHRRSQRMLNEPQARSLVGIWGVRSPRERHITDSAKAEDAVREIGLPVTLKVVSADLPHKTAVGGVQLGLTSASAVTAAIRDMCARIQEMHPGARLEGFLVQETIAGGDEAFVALTQSNGFGPVLLFGQGGTEVEGLADIAFRIAPLQISEAFELIHDTRFGRSLSQKRPEVVSNLAATLARFSTIPLQALGLAEIEINPLRLPRGTLEPVALDGVAVLQADEDAAAQPPGIGEGQVSPSQRYNSGEART